MCRGFNVSRGLIYRRGTENTEGFFVNDQKIVSRKGAKTQRFLR